MNIICEWAKMWEEAAVAYYSWFRSTVSN